ncbi:AI-2E family transporter [Lacrimispora sp.]|uniref:AI-2E family transporter n=1 Tax=Lacrimispora sp. TaxID=2719234 RepID=UPI00345F413D
MKHTRSKEFIYKILDILLVIVLAVLVYKLITNLGSFITAFKKFAKIFSPFFYGFLLAYILNIPCNGIQSLLTRTKINFLRKNKKGISIGIVYILLFFLVYVVLRMIIPAAYESILLFIKNFDRYYQTAEELLDRLNDISPVNLELSMKSLLPDMHNFSLNKLLTSFNAIVGVSAGIFKIVLVLISSIYTLMEKDRFKAFLHRILKAFTPDTVYERIICYTSKLNLSCKQYIYAQTIDGCILGTLAGIELALLGSQYALILGIMLGLVNYIPYFGSIFGTVVAFFVVMISQSVPVSLLALLILLITQQIDGNIIQPKLMSNSFSISPLLVIISVSIGGAAAGVLGMLAAIPIMATLLSILEDIITHFEEQKEKQLSQAESTEGKQEQSQ